MASKESMQGNWNEFAGAVQKKYAQVTGDDLASVKGNVKELTGLIQRKTGQARDEVETFLNSLSSNASSYLSSASHAASDYLNQAGEGLKDGYNYAVDASHEGYEVARKTVRQRPVETIATAFGIGVVAGLIAGCSIFGKR